MLEQPVHVKGIFTLFLCLAMVGTIILGADASSAASSAAGSLPEIKVFSADPSTLKDGGFALYTFEVSGAMDMQVVEAGALIKSINSPARGNLKGSVKGRTTYQIRTGNSNTFETVLVARNKSGEQKKTLTLSFETKLPAGSATGSTGQTGSDNQTKARTPKWGPQSSAGTAFPRSATTNRDAPQFVKCTTGNCNSCLRPAEAAERGYTQKCLDQPCYYSPDKQQYWYCYSKPATVWCCHDGKVVETTKEKCVEAGGSYYATEAEAIKACGQACWCCTNGRYGQTTTDACAKMGGTCFSTQSQAAAGCQPLGWFCSGGKVYQGTASQAAQAGATWYTTQAEATKACEQACWCCTNGRYGQTTTDACAKMGGTCFSTQSQAAAGCQPLGWFCRSGNVYQGTASQAAQAGATWYTTQAEATESLRATDNVLVLQQRPGLPDHHIYHWLLQDPG